MSKSLKNMYISFPPDSLLREEHCGYLVANNSGNWSLKPRWTKDLLRSIDGQTTLYQHAKHHSGSVRDIGISVLTLAGMIREGFLIASESPQPGSMKAEVSRHLPFAENAFSTPLSASIAVTNLCNRDCQHCYRKHYRQFSELSSNDWCNAIELLSQLNILSVNITGGEPFIKEGIEDIVHAASRYFRRVSINTNATAINSDHISALVDSGIDTVQIGVNVLTDTDKHSQAQNDTEHIVRICKELTDSGMRISFAIAITRQVKSKVELLNDLIYKVRPELVRIGPYVDVGGEKDKYLSVQDTVTTIRAILKGCDKSKVKATMGDGMLELIKQNSNNVNGNRQRYCMLGTGLIHIEFDGELYPCSSLVCEEFSLGNIQTVYTGSELQTVWRESSLLRELRNLTLDQLDQCRDCPVKYECAGGCRAAAFWSTGDFHGKYPHCDLNLQLKEQYDRITN